MGFWDDSSEPVEVDRRGRARRERAGLFVVLGVVLLLALLVGGGYATAYAVAGDKVPRGTRISGIRVGGLSRSAAIERLQAAFRPRAHRPIVLAAVDGAGSQRTVTIRPDRIGLRVEAAASVDRTDPHRSWRPTRLWDYFSDGRSRQAVVTVDRDALAARIRTMAGAFAAPPVDGRIVFSANGARQVQGQAGDAVDLEAAVHAVEAAYLSGAGRAQVPISPAQPAIDRTDLTDAYQEFAQPAMSAPVLLHFGTKVVRLTPRQYAGALSMVPRNGRLVPRVDTARVLRLVRRVRSSTSPVEATVRLVHGRPRVVGGRPGLTFHDTAIVRTFRRLLTASPGHRHAYVGAVRSQPDLTAADVRRLGVKQRISTFRTYVPSGGVGGRTARQVHRLDGRLLRPGQVLALASGAGPVASAVFGAGFFAGLEDLLPSEPIVVDRDAHRSAPSRVRFRNDTPYGVLVHVATTPAAPGRPAAVRVELWSSKVWRVTTRKGARTDLVAPGTRTQHGGACRPRAGVPGYRIAVTRVFRKVGQEAVDHTESFHAVYAPVDRVACR